MTQPCSSSIVACQAAASLMLVHSTFHCFGVAKSPAPMVMDDHDEEEEDDEADYVAERGVITVMIGKSFFLRVEENSPAAHSIAKLSHDVHQFESSSFPR